jgi:nucleoside-diphosphate kinase
MEEQLPRQELDQTVVLIKPDAVQRGLIGTILHRLETAGMELHEVRSVRPSEHMVRRHYQKHHGKPFFKDLVSYLADSHVVAVDVRAPEAVDGVRDMVGDTEPASADSGTIRGDLGEDSFAAADAEDRAVRNLVHASDSAEAAEREAALWF